MEVVTYGVIDKPLLLFVNFTFGLILKNCIIKPSNYTEKGISREHLTITRLHIESTRAHNNERINTHTRTHRKLTDTHVHKTKDTHREILYIHRDTVHTEWVFLCTQTQSRWNHRRHTHLFLVVKSGVFSCRSGLLVSTRCSRSCASSLKRSISYKDMRRTHQEKGGCGVGVGACLACCLLLSLPLDLFQLTHQCFCFFFIVIIITVKEGEQKYYSRPQ